MTKPNRTKTKRPAKRTVNLAPLLRIKAPGKKDQQRWDALVCHIGSRWEPILGTFTASLSASNRDTLAKYVIQYYRRNPQHPYHPKKRPAFDPFCVVHDYAPSMIEGEYSAYLKQVVEDIEEYHRSRSGLDADDE